MAGSVHGEAGRVAAGTEKVRQLGEPVETGALAGFSLYSADEPDQTAGPSETAAAQAGAAVPARGPEFAPPSGRPASGRPAAWDAREPAVVADGSNDSTRAADILTSRPGAPAPYAPETLQPAVASIPPFEGPAPIPAEPILEAVGVMEGVADTASPPGFVRESEHQPTGDELLVAAEAADLAGDEKALRSLLVWTARAYAREGRFDAGLDATHRLLQRSPGDVDAHLVLVELYLARNWNTLAAEKLVLLGRLAELNNDEETRQRLCAVASRAFPRDERLEVLCS